ncbi:MAG: hypothetical protein CMN29_21460 [Sandaracinus sp.]|nr:hypothetical protein [Sandaracinus sp.]
MGRGRVRARRSRHVPIAPGGACVRGGGVRNVTPSSPLSRPVRGTWGGHPLARCPQRGPYRRPMEGEALLSRALDGGDPAAAGELVDRLLPAVQIRVARALRRHGPRGRDARQEMQDLVQEVFARLFAEDAKVLRAWDPARGASLSTFVGVVAEREVVGILRTRKRSPFTEEATETVGRELQAPRSDVPEARVADREAVAVLLEGLRARLSPLGFRVFELLWAEQRSVEEVCAELAMKRDAVYAWRSRIRKLARALAEESAAEGAS